MTQPLYTLPRRLTIENAKEAHASLLALNTQACAQVVLDAKNLEGLTTPGMQLLLALDAKLAAEGKKLRLENLGDAAAEALRFCGLDDQASAWTAAERKIGS